MDQVVDVWHGDRRGQSGQFLKEGELGDGIVLPIKTSGNMSAGFGKLLPEGGTDMAAYMTEDNFWVKRRKVESAFINKLSNARLSSLWARSRKLYLPFVAETFVFLLVALNCVGGS